MEVEATRLYRVKAVAVGLDVSPATIYRAIESGKLRAIRIGTSGKGALRVRGEAISAYLGDCETTGADAWTEAA